MPLDARHTVALLVALSLAWRANLQAQDSIASDRPGLATGSAVIDAGIVQLETGLGYADADGDELFSIGQLLVRIGYESFELRLLGNSYLVQRGDAATGTPDEEGFEDLAVGVKVPVVRAPDAGYSFSFDALITAPTGSTAFTRDDWSGAVNALLDVAWGRSGNLTANAGFTGGAKTIEEAWTLNVTPALSFGGGWGAYGGWTGVFAGSDDTHFADAGVTWVPSSNLQLDVNGGWNLDGKGWFFGFGLATRWGAG